jgi:benzoate/toluate 1,2-dioxygenase reductase subunit
VTGYLAANRAFHEHVVGLAGSPALLELYRALEVHRLEPRAMDGTTRADPVLVDDHRRLVEAFERADLPVAVRVLQDHAARPRQLGAAGPSS